MLLSQNGKEKMLAMETAALKLKAGPQYEAADKHLRALQAKKQKATQAKHPLN